MTFDVINRGFEWRVCSEYYVKAGNLHVVQGRPYRVYRPADIDDLPSRLTDVLRGKEAIKQFAMEFGLLGYSSDFKYSVQDWLKGRSSRGTFETWFDERAEGGEPLKWIQAHARTVLVLKHASAFLEAPDSRRLAWRTFVKQHGQDRLVIQDQKLCQLLELPVVANLESTAANHLFRRDLCDESKARRTISVLLENNLQGAIEPTFNVDVRGRPTMHFRFDSLIHYIYWELFQQMSTSLTRICPCGEFFQTRNRLQIHHDPRCTNRMNQRKHRERTSLGRRGRK